METRVSVRVHANYVQTCVKFHKTGLTYLEYGTCDPKIVRDILTLPTRVEVRAYLDGEGAPFELNAVTMPEFEGVLELRFTFTTHDKNADFVVEHARYTSPRTGSKQLEKAFQNEKFKLPMMQNIAKLIAERNVSKLEEVLKTLRDAY